MNWYPFLCEKVGYFEREIEVVQVLQKSKNKRWQFKPFEPWNFEFMQFSKLPFLQLPWLHMGGGNKVQTPMVKPLVQAFFLPSQKKISGEIDKQKGDSNSVLSNEMNLLISKCWTSFHSLFEHVTTCWTKRLHRLIPTLFFSLIRLWRYRYRGHRWTLEAVTVQNLSRHLWVKIILSAVQESIEKILILMAKKFQIHEIKEGEAGGYHFFSSNKFSSITV